MGCDKVAPECQHCYISRGLYWKGRPPYGACYRTSPEQWKKPERWQRELEQIRLLNGNQAKRVFTCSISDFFNARADEWRPEVWKIISSTPSLVWCVLTKRPERIVECLPADWGNGYPNVWLGVSTGCKRTLAKMDTLRSIPAALRWASCEPLLEDISADINLDGFDWIATGGESGSDRRVMSIGWAARLRDRVKSADLAFMFKQITAEYQGTGINALGREWHEIPDPPQGMTWAPRKGVPRCKPYFLTRSEIRQLWKSQGADRELCDCEI
jgi:protein gp37